MDGNDYDPETAQIATSGTHEVTVTNTPDNPTTVSLSVSKTWADGADIARAVQFTLYQKADASAQGAEKIGDNYYVVVTKDAGGQAVSPRVILADRAENSDGTVAYSWPSGENNKVTWTNLPKPKEGAEYYVRETGVYFSELTEEGKLPKTAQFEAPEEKYTVEGGTVSFKEGAVKASTEITNTPLPLVDVPVEKTWADFNEKSEYNWSATFRLQWAPLYEGQTVPTVAFSDVQPIQEMTITKAQMMKPSESAEARTFKDLPKYATNENGVKYRIQYSLDEVSYKVWTTDENNPVYTWTKGVGYNLEDEATHYEAFYPHDAGEKSDADSDYYISVANAVRRTEKDYIDFQIKKQWDPSFKELPEDWSASFELRRYKHTEYRDISHVSDEDILNDNRITLTLVDSANNTLGTISVYPNTGIYLAGTFAPRTENKSITFSYNGNSVMVTATGANAGKEIVRSDEIFLTENTTITLTAGEENLDGGSRGAQILDTRAGTNAEEDTSFTKISFNLTNNSSSKEFNDLLFRETSLGDDDGNENVTVYGYYFVETDSTLESDATFYTADSEGNPTTVLTGDEANRIYADRQNVVAVNTPSSKLKVEKAWRGVPDTTGYPEVTFTLYQGWLNWDGTAVSPNSGDSWVYENESGTKYEDIPLNEQNEWTWTCPENLPTTKLDPTYWTGSSSGAWRKVGYFVVENPTRGYEGTPYQWQLYYYYNSEGKRTNGNPQNVGIVGNSGTLGIMNRMGNYIELDIKKQFFTLNADGSWANDTEASVAQLERGVLLGFKVIRRAVYLDTNVKTEWKDYGDEMRVGYDNSGRSIMDNGNNDFYLRDAGSRWFFQIHNNYEPAGGQNEQVGLPGYGFYERNGERVPVMYEYSYRETNVYKFVSQDANGTIHVTDYPEWDWWSSITPNRYVDGNGTVHKGENDPRANVSSLQDEDRIANFQASDLEIDKEWLGTTDVQEVYVKIYRYTKNPANAEDFTAVISTDITDNQNWQGYVDDTSIIDTENHWLILTPNSSGQWSASVKINRALIKTIDREDGLTYTYYIQEVGYKDKNGNVHSGTGSVLVYDPHYDKWIDGHWEGTTKIAPTEKAIQIGAKSENRLKVINAPVMDLSVEKKWVDENGEETEPWNEEVTFKVQLEFTKYKDGIPAGQPETTYLTFFNGNSTSQTLTVKANGQRVTLQHIPESDDGTSHTKYNVTVTEVDTLGAWKTRIDGLQSRYVCDNGDEYHCKYYIKEVVSSGSEVTITGNGVTESGQLVTVTNKKASSGALKITKLVTLNGQPLPADSEAKESPLDGTYKFEIFNEDGITKAVKADGTAIGEIAITFTGGKVTNPEEGYALVDILTPGIYVIKEVTPENGTTLILAERGDKDSTAVTQDKAVSVVVVAGDATAAKTSAQASFTNNLVQTDIKILKVDRTTKKELEGAKFSLLWCKTETGTYTIIEEIDDVELDENHWFTVPKDGITLKGLKPGFYKVTEEVSPAGYLITEKTPVAFQVNDKGEVINKSIDTVTYTGTGEKIFTVPNTSGTELPQTGGIGTTLFTALGGLMTVAAGAVLTLKSYRRRKQST